MELTNGQIQSTHIGGEDRNEQVDLNAKIYKCVIYSSSLICFNTCESTAFSASILTFYSHDLLLAFVLITNAQSLITYAILEQY